MWSCNHCLASGFHVDYKMQFLDTHIHFSLVFDRMSYHFSRPNDMKDSPKMLTVFSEEIEIRIYILHSKIKFKLIT